MSKTIRIPTANIFFVVMLTTCLIASAIRPLSAPMWIVGSVTIFLLLATLVWKSAGAMRRPTMMAAASVIISTTTVFAHDLNYAGDHPLNDWLGEDRQYAEIEARVLDGPTFYDEGISFDAELLNLDLDLEGELTTPKPKIRVFYSTKNIDACTRLPLPGDRFTTWARIDRFSPPDVPWRTSQRGLMEGRGYTARASALEPLAFAGEPELNLASAIKRPLTIHRILLERRVQRHIQGDAYGLAAAMLTGSRGQLRSEFRLPFDITSTGHILAISGLHFGVIAGLIAFCVQFLLNRFPRIYRRWPRRMVIGLITVVFLLAYLLAIGAPISGRRAFGMTLIAITVISFSPWRLSPISTLSATAGLLLLYQPSLAVEIGFQLSMAATGGICLFMKCRPPSLLPPELLGSKEESRSSRWRRASLTFIGFSTAATIATWPILMQMSGEIPISGLWTNLIVVPLVSAIIFPVLVAGALITSVSPMIAGLLLTLSTESLILIQVALDEVAYWPGTVYRWGTPTAAEFIGFSVAALIAIGDGLRPRAMLIGTFIGALFCTPGLIVDHFEEPTLRVHFIPVGQGDATLIELPEGTTILIDAGGTSMGADPGLHKVAPYLQHQGIHRLDALVLTHGDLDHFGGIPALIRPFRPRQFYVGADEDGWQIHKIIEQMKVVDTETIWLESEEVIRTDEVSVHIRRPQLPNADPNDRSLVVTFSYGGVGALFPGDLEVHGEAWLVENIPGQRALLKVGHHGSRTSSSEEFLDHLMPAVAVSSSGRHNHFGHPHPEVLERYEHYDIDLYRTDLQGVVEVEITGGGEMRVKHLNPT